MIYDCRHGELQEIDDAQRAFEEFIRLHHEVKRGLAEGSPTHDPVHIWQGIWSGDYDCLIHNNSILVAELQKTPKMMIYHCFVTAGEMKEVLDLMKLRKHLGLSRGADLFTGVGRRGWCKVLGLSDKLTLYSET